MNQLPKAWSIPDILLERTDLDLAEKIVIAIFDRLGALEKPIYPRHQWLAERMGMTERGIKKILKRLEEKGWVNFEGRRWKIAQYTLNALTGTEFRSSQERSSGDSQERSSSHNKHIQRKGRTNKENTLRDGETPLAEGVFNSEKYIYGLIEDKQRHIHIIGFYWKAKKYSFENLISARKSLRRDLRAAEALTGYSDKRIIETLKWLLDNPPPSNKWTLETVHKYIDEDLQKIKGQELHIDARTKK